MVGTFCIAQREARRGAQQSSRFPRDEPLEKVPLCRPDCMVFADTDEPPEPLSASNAKKYWKIAYHRMDPPRAAG
jgi:hypothetical protein